ncbi:hypothetical protein AGMMS49941_10860 [Deferribacterales bacterium]|nr:hypothetical protein AGMMS49941_10860 [Deferribacterales bacterium]
MLAFILPLLFYEEEMAEAVYEIFSRILCLILFINPLIKRCHDRNRSGWFILLFLVPIVNLWAIIELGFLRGTVGDNKYGCDPLQQQLN